MSHDAADTTPDEEFLQLSAADMVWWSNVFKTLGDPVRLQLLVHLAAQRGVEVAVHDLCDVGVAQSTVSHHLKRLRSIGLIENRRDGRVVYYRMGAGVRSALMQILHQSGQAHAPAISPLPGAQGSGSLPP